MLTRDGARLQVWLELRRRHGLWRGPKEIVIVDSKVREFAWGWLFPYTTRGWLNGDIRYAVGGNGPVLINRYNGLMTFCPTCLTPEECVARFEAKLAAAEQSSESR